MNTLFTLSESRGKEAAGLAVRSGEVIAIHKEAVSASKMIHGVQYTQFLNQKLASVEASAFSLIGHARLVTNGLQDMNFNNQPVIKDCLVGVHNGIITNDAELWKTHPELRKEYQVDTEVLLALINQSTKDDTHLPEALKKAFDLIEGNATLSLLTDNHEGLLLATNNGSLYYSELPDSHALIFASERYILQELFNTDELKTIWLPGQSYTLKQTRPYLLPPDLHDWRLNRSHFWTHPS